MQKVFNDNPSLDFCYGTSDGKYFFLKNDAQNHARNLEDTKVIKVTRLEDEKKEDSKGIDVNPEEELAQKKKELQELELVSKNYNKMKSLASYFNLETEGNKAEDLIKALEDYKQQISE